MNRYTLARAFLDSRLSGRLSASQRNATIMRALHTRHTTRPVLGGGSRAPGEGAVQILALGDLALVHRSGGVAPTWDRMAALEPHVRDADLATGNFEAMIAAPDTAAVGEIGSFIKAEEAAIPLLARLGIGAVTTANNHALDFGVASYVDSRKKLEAQGIATVGGAGEPARIVYSRGDTSVAMLGACDDVRIPTEGAPNPVELLHDRTMHERIAEARADGHIVVVHLHWGFEWIPIPMLSLRDRARSMADAGAHVVLCHHAHVPMGVEVYNKSVVAHGLGNAFFPFVREPDHVLREAVPLLKVSVSREGVHEATVDWLWHQQSVGLAPPSEAQEAALHTFQSRANHVLENPERLQAIENDRAARLLRSAVVFCTRASQGRSDATLKEYALLLRVPHRAALHAYCEAWELAPLSAALLAFAEAPDAKKRRAAVKAVETLGNAQRTQDTIRRLTPVAAGLGWLP